jgi:hypothetical protein
MEQITMGMNIAAEMDIDRIRTTLEQELGNPEYIKYLSVVENKDGSFSIKAKSNLTVKIKFAKKSSYIEVDPKYERYFSGYEIKRTSNDWSRVLVAGIEDVLALGKRISIVYLEELSKLGGEHFGCCHRYVQCSDALKCLHPDFLISLACGYKKNLELGKVFYGKNKNI